MRKRQKNALSYLKRHKSIKSKTYAKINRVSIATAVKEINELVSYDFLKKMGQFRWAYYVLGKQNR